MGACVAEERTRLDALGAAGVKPGGRESSSPRDDSLLSEAAAAQRAVRRGGRRPRQRRTADSLGLSLCFFSCCVYAFTAETGVACVMGWCVLVLLLLRRQLRPDAGGGPLWSLSLRFRCCKWSTT